jgi:hypothetical protein
MHSVNDWVAIIRDGISHINPIQGLIIGVLAGWMVGSIGSLIVTPVVAAIVYVAVDALKPVIFDHKPFAMPAMDTPFWHHFASLYVAFLVIAAVIWAIRAIISSIRG